MRDTFVAALEELAEADSSLLLVTGDLGFGVFEGFADRYPERFLNAGIAEQNMIGLSSGLAMEGFTVFAYSIGNFPVLRCLEQIRNDAAYHGASVKVVSVGGGFSYGPLGMSHHATEDIAVMRAIPGVTCFTPGTLSDVQHSVNSLLATPGVGYLRLDKSHGADQEGAETFSPGRWRIMSHGDDATLVAVGGVLAEAQAAANELAVHGVNVRVVNATQMAPLGYDEVIDSVGSPDWVVTLEEHITRGGLAGVVAEALAVSGSRSRLHPKGVGDRFVSEVGSQMYLRRVVGLDSVSIVSAVRTLVA